MNGTDAVGGEFTLISGSNASTPLAANASAGDVAEAVNSMVDWKGLVLVDRQELLAGETSGGEDDDLGDLFEWRLTFSPADGDVEGLRVSRRRSIAVDLVAILGYSRRSFRTRNAEELGLSRCGNLLASFTLFVLRTFGVLGPPGAIRLSDFM